MYKTLFIVLILLGSMVGLLGYIVVLTQWVHTYTTGLAMHNPGEGLIKLLALVAYTYFGVRFFYRHMNLLQ